MRPRHAASLSALPVFFASLLHSTGLSEGAGYYLPNQDAFATARGNAFVATADSAAAVHYNPAGLTQLEAPQVSLGVYGIHLGNKARNAGVTSEAKSEWQAAPHLYYAIPVSDSLSYGFGLNSPFGLGTEWGQGTPFRTAITEARLLYSRATAAVAWKASDTVSIGLSISGNYADILFEQGLGFMPGDYLRFEGDGFSASAGIGLLWQPSPCHSFGLTYNTRTTSTLRGDVESNLLPDDSGRLSFMTPARAAIGYSYRPAPGWNIEANIEWLDWDSLNDLTLRSDSVPGGRNAIAFNWKSNLIYELGVSYTTPSGFVYAVGYDLNGNAQPDADFNPGVSDADRHWFNAGIGKRGDTCSWFLAYQFGYSDRDVTNSNNPAVNGSYEARHHAVVLTWQRDF